jgi:4'-phosphopantetheinyl transferase
MASSRKHTTAVGSPGAGGGQPRADATVASVRLQKGEVRIWSTSLEVGAAELQDRESVLSEDERRRARRFVFERDRVAFVAARAALRSILARCTAVDAASIQFAYAAAGKPELAGAAAASGIRFNLSHSEALAVIAVALERPIGADVEWLGREVDYEPVARTFFSAAEVAALTALPPHLRKQGFFNCWTRKEAFLKATGEGIGSRHARFDVSLAPGEPARLLRIGDEHPSAAHWHLHAFEPAPGYVAAVAFQGECTRLSVASW